MLLCYLYLLNIISEGQALVSVVWMESCTAFNLEHYSVIRNVSSMRNIKDTL